MTEELKLIHTLRIETTHVSSWKVTMSLAPTAGQVCERVWECLRDVDGRRYRDTGRIRLLRIRVDGWQHRSIRLSGNLARAALFLVHIKCGGRCESKNKRLEVEDEIRRVPSVPAAQRSIKSCRNVRAQKWQKRKKDEVTSGQLGATAACS